MVDNANLTAGDGSLIAGADDIGGVKYPRAKVVWGPDGTVNDTDVASGKPLPVQLRSSTGVAASFGAGASDTGTTRVTIDSGQLASLGQAAMAASVPVALASNQSSIPVTNTPLTNFGAGEYETVAASQTAQVLGPTGATGDYISHLVVIPANLNPGNILLLDNATSITLFAGGTGSVTTLHPFTIDLRMISVSGAWKVTTGASVSVIGVGNFT